MACLDVVQTCPVKKVDGVTQWRRGVLERPGDLASDGLYSLLPCFSEPEAERRAQV